MKSFKEFISENPVDLQSLAQEYIDSMDKDKVNKVFGTGDMNSICTEPGNCAMVSEHFIDWLGTKGVAAKSITAYEAINKSWAKHARVTSGGDEDAHTAVLVNNKVIDLTARQFDPNAKFPKITSLDQFKSEWKGLC